MQARNEIASTRASTNLPLGLSLQPTKSPSLLQFHGQTEGFHCQNALHQKTVLDFPKSYNLQKVVDTFEQIVDQAYADRQEKVFLLVEAR